MASVNLDIASNLGIFCRKGDTFRLELTISDSTSTPINTALYDYTMLVKDSKGGTVLTFSGADFKKSTDGSLVINKDAETMNGLTPASYRYDLQSTKNTDGFVQTWIFGNFTVKDDVS